MASAYGAGDCSAQTVMFLALNIMIALKKL